MRKMGRPWIVPVLVFAVVLTGCAHQKPLEKTDAPAGDVTQADLGQTLQRYSRESWIEKYPVLNSAAQTTGTVLLVLGITALFVGFVVLAAMAEDGQSGPEGQRSVAPAESSRPGSR
jgi:hypothetical protein